MVAKVILAVSAFLGITGALNSMGTARALHSAAIILGGNTSIEPGVTLAALLWTAAGLHLLVAGYVTFDMPGGRGRYGRGGGSFGGENDHEYGADTFNDRGGSPGGR